MAGIIIVLNKSEYLGKLTSGGTVAVNDGSARQSLLVK